MAYSSPDPLEIDTRSGDLRITGQLDFEGPNKTIQFTAVAYNPGSPELNDTATVTVVVLDVNDEAPVFRNTPYATTLNEGNYSTEMAVGLQVCGAWLAVTMYIFWVDGMLAELKVIVLVSG